MRGYLLVGSVPQDADGFQFTKPKGGFVVGNRQPVESEIMSFDLRDPDKIRLMAVVEVTDEDSHNDGAHASARPLQPTLMKSST